MKGTFHGELATASKRAGGFTAACALVLEGLAAAFTLMQGRADIGLALHAASALLARRAAWARSRPSRSELDVVFLLALGVPVIGPALAWLAPTDQDSSRTIDAHEAFEAARPKADFAHARSSGRESFDLRNRLEVEGFDAVIRTGHTTARANLVRLLASRRRPSDLVTLRRFLDDPEDELRIQAFLSLRKVHDDFLDRIDAELRSAAEPADPATTLGIARLHLDLARSGALDPELESFEYERAVEVAEGLLATDVADEATAIQVDAFGHLDRWDDAMSAFSRLEQPTASTLETMARIAFRIRNRALLGSIENRMHAAEVPVPGWVQTALARPEHTTEDAHDGQRNAG